MVPSVLLIKQIASPNAYVNWGKAPVVPESSHRDCFTTAYFKFTISYPEIILQFLFKIVGKMDNMWLIGTNWTIGRPSIQIG
jgi:hypothetical protein